ncbi:MAG: hypothetical protein ACREXS_01730 [Gammaproteobacteria bacterium]
MKQSLKTSALVGVFSVVCIGAQAGGTGDRAKPSPAVNAPSAGAGMKVYVDPKTGEFLEQPPKGAEPLVTPSAALPEPVLLEAPGPEGGDMVDVQGRFQTPLEATIGPDGKPAIRHRDESPGPVLSHP